MNIGSLFLLLGLSMPGIVGYAHKMETEYPEYKGKDLGVIWNKSLTSIRLWAPTADAVSFLLYREGFGGLPLRTITLVKSEKGTWSGRLDGDWDGYFYTFKVKHNGVWLQEVPDPQAKAVGINGLRGMVVNLESTNPADWIYDRGPVLKEPTDAVIYELHIRDLSIHPQSGISRKGKFLGLTEEGTLSPAGLSTGLDYIQQLGVTHIHLLPAFDFRSLDESVPDPGYNWGYDPRNYNVPEGTYSTMPADGKSRIREFKQMVKTLHERRLGVILDVVYNHTGDTEKAVFQQIVPGYYYRFKEDGSFSNASGCGNETASERPMMRRFILESLVHWVSEYHVDGFRFDLMGIHDLETMQHIRDTLRKIKPDILLYGEGWTAGSSPVPDADRALKANMHLLPGIAAFSDELRDGIKGHVFHPEEKGFVSSKTDLAESVRFGIAGGVFHPQVRYEAVNYSKKPWATEPGQTIVYASCHDNHTLWDRLTVANPEQPEPARMAMQVMALGIVLTSQGIPFLHAGCEFLRTKQGVENSFESPDAINYLDWVRRDQYNGVVTYVSNLINLRRNHPAFRLGNASAIRSHLTFHPHSESGIISYSLDAVPGEPWKHIYVVLNGTGSDQAFTLPYAFWKTVVDGEQVTLNPEQGFTGNNGRIKPFSILVLQTSEHLPEPNLKE